jgi:lipopolysaccharide heptosyltransferase I
MPKLGRASPPQPILFNLAPQRVCIIKPSALGDIVNALPALSALRGLWPGSAITWVVNRSFQGLVKGHPQIDEVVAYDRASGGALAARIAGFPRLLRELHSRRFDLAIDLQGLLRSGIMTAATRAPIRVGLSDAREGASWFYTHRVVPPGTRENAHAVDRLLAVAAAFGADVTHPRGVVNLNDEDRRWAQSVLSTVAHPRVCLNLGARWETKRWPPSHFAEIARRAVAARGAGLFAVGANEDRPYVDEFIRRLAPISVLDLSGQTTLSRLAALAEQADLMISNDTGPLHLAAACGTRVVGMYTCTSPRANGPFGPDAAWVASTVWCAASYHVRCPRRLECMAELSPDRVWPVVLHQLREPSKAESRH